MSTAKERERDEAREQLRELFADRKRIVTVYRGHSASGLTRYLDVYVTNGDDLDRITWTIGKAFGIDYDRKRECLKFGGGGYSIVTEVTYALSTLLGGDGYTITADEH